MRHDLNAKLVDEIHNSPNTTRLLVEAAHPMAAEIAAATPTDTSMTRDSTHVESGHRAADNRSVAARIVQAGAAVPLQFPNSRDKTPVRQFDRAGGGR